MWYRLDAARSQVIVGPRAALLTHWIRLREVNWLGDGALGPAALPIHAKVRSTRAPRPAELHQHDNETWVRLIDGEDGVSPGQACVFLRWARTGRARARRRLDRGGGPGAGGVSTAEHTARAARALDVETIARRTVWIILAYFAAQLAIRVGLSGNLETDEAQFVGHTHFALGYGNSHPPLVELAGRAARSGHRKLAGAVAIVKTAFLAGTYL